MTTITRLIGVYNADGVLAGEARYIVGHLLGLTSCSLCDITHSPLRRKPEWDAMVNSLDIPLTVLHRNELSAELAEWIRPLSLPLIVGLSEKGEFHLVIDSISLSTTNGSIPAFREVLEHSLEILQ